MELIGKMPGRLFEIGARIRAEEAGTFPQNGIIR
jgi:hypothetical protein